MELVSRARALFHGQRAEAVRVGRLALDAARAAGDAAAAALALNLLADADRVEGKMDSALSLAREGLRNAEAAGNASARADAINNLGLLAWHRGEFSEAAELFGKSLSIREQQKNDHDIAATCNNLSLVHWEMGNLALAMDFQQRSLAIKERIGDRYGVGVSQLNLGLIHVDLGDWDKALECYFRALAEKEHSGDKSDVALCYNNIGEIYLRRGKLGRARFHLEKALELATAAPSAWVQSEVLGNLGEVAFAAGNVGRARDCYERDRQICLETDDRQELAETMRRTAELDLAQGRLADCEAALGSASELAGKVGLKRELGNVHQVRAELRDATGDRTGAKAEFEQSLAVFRTLGKNYELACTLGSYGRFLKGIADSSWPSVLTEALGLFESLGVEPRTKETERLLAVDEGRGTKDEGQGNAGVLEQLTALACAGLDTARFCQEVLSVVAERLPAEAAAVLLRDGRVFQQGRMEVGERDRGRGTGDEEQTGVGRVSIPLDVGTGRVGTLVVRTGMTPSRVKPLADLIALGVSQAQARPASVGIGDQGSGVGTERRFPGIVGAGTTLKPVFDTIEQVAPTRAGVLILGESGTGKELVARTIHALSDRKAGPLVVVNCAAIPENLLESELFGIEPGTATGVSGRKGRFELARGGTVFLDEIGDMGLNLQAKILRLLQEKTFERVGGREPVVTDVRVVAATNRNLEEAIAAGRFRSDLFYRLNVITLNLPPLRQRKQDMPALAFWFVSKFSREYAKPMQGVSDDCLACLLSHDWPGNVRELENTIERAVILARGGLVTAADLPASMRKAGTPEPEWRAIRKTVKEAAAAPLETGAILAALEQSGWIVKNAATALHISRREIYRLMKKHNIHRPSDRDSESQAPNP
jgi:DNA-binding NtrC family response regulator/tetratricopeptide (TPR) repeat protein